MFTNNFPNFHIFVITSSGNNGNHYLLNMILFTSFIGGYLHTKFEISSQKITLSSLSVLDGFEKDVKNG